MGTYTMPIEEDTDIPFVSITILFLFQAFEVLESFSWPFLFDTASTTLQIILALLLMCFFATAYINNVSETTTIGNARFVLFTRRLRHWVPVIAVIVAWCLGALYHYGAFTSAGSVITSSVYHHAASQHYSTTQDVFARQGDTTGLLKEADLPDVCISATCDGSFDNCNYFGELCDDAVLKSSMSTLDTLETEPKGRLQEVQNALKNSEDYNALLQSSVQNSEVKYRDAMQAKTSAEKEIKQLQDARTYDKEALDRALEQRDYANDQLDRFTEALVKCSTTITAAEAMTAQVERELAKCEERNLAAKEEHNVNMRRLVVASARRQVDGYGKLLAKMKQVVGAS